MLKNLTAIILTYKTDEKILDNCIQSINSSINICIVENSNDQNIKDKLQNKYPNIDVVLSGNNFGYGAGNNFGLNHINTRYALIINPDIVLDSNFFSIVKSYFDKGIEFNIMGISYKNNLEWNTAGYFKNNQNNNQNLINPIDSSLIAVDWVAGCTMLIDLDKFDKKNIFDENIFLYFDEFDLCQIVKKNNGTVFTSKKLLVNHLGNKGSSSTNINHRLSSEILRNWHWMWSTFYYYKKHYGYFYALRKTYFKLLKSFFKIIYYKIFYNKDKFYINLYRFLGLLDSMLGKKSAYRNPDFSDQETSSGSS